MTETDSGEATVLEYHGSVGRGCHALARELYPICRSITGDGLRRSLDILAREIPLTIREVPSGTQVFDWTVPKEWNIREAWIKDSSGRKIIDFREHNLHVLNYSVPFSGSISWDELRPHLYSLPEHPDWIPYRTSYYREDWGFCLPHRRLEQLGDGTYEVLIDSELSNGSLSLGELKIPGRTDREILISCHCCHPSLANDNLSGMTVATMLARERMGRERHFSYRFLFIPGTIGSIAWLATHENDVSAIEHGLVLAGVGDRSGFTYKRSRRGTAVIDRAVVHLLNSREQPSEVRDFSPYGYDERQFCSVGFDLPVGRLSRTPHGEYPQYHTSADDLDFLHPDSLQESFEFCLELMDLLEENRRYRNLSPKCEPQLGKRGLYGALGGFPDPGAMQMAMLWMLNQSDGEHSVLDVAERSGMRFADLAQAASVLRSHGLLEEIGATQP